MQKKGSGQRKVHIDLLRIVACFCVVMIHVSAMFWYRLPIESAGWQSCNAYDALASFGVPMFVMVSGMLFLGREGEIDVKRLYRGNIFRLVIIYCVWSTLYSMWGLRDYLGQPDFPWGEFWSFSLQGKYHLWFIPMIMVIYILLPMLKTWLNHADKRQVEYILSWLE